MLRQCINLTCDRFRELGVLEYCQGCLSPLVPIPGPQPSELLTFEPDLGEHRVLAHEKVDSNTSAMSTQPQVLHSTAVSLDLN